VAKKAKRKIGDPTGKTYKDGSPKRYGLDRSGKRKAPPSPAQRAAQARIAALGRAGAGGRGRGRGPARGGAEGNGGGDMDGLSASELAAALRTAGRPVRDRTPSVPEPPTLRGPQFSIQREFKVQYQPDDVLALALALIGAARLRHVHRDTDEARFTALLGEWFEDVQGLGVLPSGIDLRSEVTMFSEVLKALPFAAQRTGFGGEEWGNLWNDLVGETMGILPVGPPVSAGLDAPFPPVRGTVTTRFNPPTHNGVDIAAPMGSPIVAPEDVKVMVMSTTGDFGNHLVLVSRNPANGKYPWGGSKEHFAPAEGVRVHTLAHMLSFGPGVRSGAEIERGAVVGYVDATGRVRPSGPGGSHLHWMVQLYVLDRDGKAKLTPMDPSDLVPYDVMGGIAPARPPSPSWTVVDPKVGGRTEAPSYNVYAHGDIIFRGSKTTVDVSPDIDVGLGLGLGIPRPGEDEFIDTHRARFGAGAGRLAGGVLGGLFGGPAGAVAGGRVGQSAGGLLDNLFQRRGA